MRFKGMPLQDYDSFLLGMTSERCTQLEQERDEARLVAQEAQQNMSQYENVRQISSTDINISDVKLGGGSYGGKIIFELTNC